MLRMKRKLAQGQARGSKHGNKIGVYTSFDPDMYEEILARAKKNKTSFAQALRDIVEFGLEEYKKYE